MVKFERVKFGRGKVVADPIYISVKKPAGGKEKMKVATFTPEQVRRCFIFLHLARTDGLSAVKTLQS